MFKIISSQLEDPSNQESFQRGVSASGYFSAFCPSTLKTNVRSLTHVRISYSVLCYKSLFLATGKSALFVSAFTQGC